MQYNDNVIVDDDDYDVTDQDAEGDDDDDLATEEVYNPPMPATVDTATGPAIPTQPTLNLGPWDPYRFTTWQAAETHLQTTLNTWRPPHPDPDVPPLNSIKFMQDARRVYDALINTVGIKDKPMVGGRRGNRVLKGGYDQDMFQARAIQVIVSLRLTLACPRSLMHL